MDQVSEIRAAGVLIVRAGVPTEVRVRLLLHFTPIVVHWAMPPKNQ